MRISSVSKLCQLDGDVHVQEVSFPAQVATTANTDKLTLTCLIQELEKHRANLTAEYKEYLSVLIETSLVPTRLSFISRLLQTIIRKHIFLLPPVLERAHRILAAKPEAGQRPRDIVVGFLYSMRYLYPARRDDHREMKSSSKATRCCCRRCCRDKLDSTKKGKGGVKP